MTTTIKFGVAGILLSLASVANAETIYASNPVYAGQSGGSPVTCRVYNPGPGKVTIQQNYIFTNEGHGLNFTGDSCFGAILTPRQSCTYAGQSPGNLSFVCEIIVSGPTKNVSGTIEINLGGSFATQEFVRQP